MRCNGPASAHRISVDRIRELNMGLWWHSWILLLAFPLQMNVECRILYVQYSMAVVALLMVDYVTRYHSVGFHYFIGHCYCSVIILIMMPTIFHVTTLITSPNHCRYSAFLNFKWKTLHSSDLPRVIVKLTVFNSPTTTLAGCFTSIVCLDNDYYLQMGKRKFIIFKSV